MDFGIEFEIVERTREGNPSKITLSTQDGAGVYLLRALAGKTITVGEHRSVAMSSPFPEELDLIIGEKMA